MVAESGRKTSGKREPYSLAVLNGADTGKVLRTGRRTISIGSAPDNDLVLTDTDVAAHHLVVSVEESTWRADSSSSDQRIVIDRRWVHPNNGKNGALIYAGGSELLLFPGDLDDATIQREIKLRRTDKQVPAAPPPVLNTPRSRSGEMTIALPSVGRPGAIPNALSQAPTRILTRSMISEPPSIPPPSTTIPEPDRAERSDPSLSTGHKPASAPDWSPGTNAWGDGGKRRESQERIAARAAPIERQAMEAESTEPGPAASPAGRTRKVTNAWGEVVEVPIVDAEIEPPAPRTSVPPPAPIRPIPGGAWGRTAAEPKPGAAPTGNAWDRAAEMIRAEPEQLSETELDFAPPGLSSGSAPAAAHSRPSLPATAPAMVLSEDALRVIEDAALMVVREPDSEYAHSIRLLSTRLEALTKTDGYRAFMISSPEPLTGKTTTVVNLAFALAEDHHRRVAVLEADFRHPRMAAILGAPPDVGLLALLRGEQDVNEASIRVADRNLIFFPSGGKHDTPSDYLTAPRLRALLSGLADTVDIVIIDAPAIQPYADANLLLPLVDGVLLTVLDGETRAIWVDGVFAQLGQDRVLGAIMNRLDRRLRRSLTVERRARPGSR